MIAENIPPVAVDVAPLPAPAPPPSAPAAEPAAQASSPMLKPLLRMADGYRARGALWNAMEIYCKIVKQHSESPEAKLACERLLEIAQWHEKNGKAHLARGIYEQLL
jgi:hypothetical protein